MKKIALEEAIIPEGMDLILEHKSHPEYSQHYHSLMDIGDIRLAEMDKANIELSVLSITTPGLQGFALPSNLQLVACQWNDYIIKAVQKHPKRFKAFACLPTYAPALAVQEMERIYKTPEIVGCLLNGYDNSGYSTAKYLDNPAYDDFWACAETCDFPVYIHPRGIPEDRKATYSDYPALRGSAWGFHIETAEHILRLMLSGVFDRYPKLKVIIGHMGEMLPFWAWRIDHRIKEEGWREKIACKKTIREYLQSNIFITTSGYFDTPALLHAKATMGTDRIMFSVDYPYENCVQAGHWMDTLSLSHEDKEKIAYKNASGLLKLQINVQDEALG